MSATYDTIGVNYSNLRMPDARIEQMISEALGSSKTVLNVGAGTGSYEPADRSVTAIEPSEEMIAQRSPSAAPVLQGYAEDLPFDDNAFDAAMAILTIHHWSDRQKGLKEMRRVTRGPLVILTFDPSYQHFWLADYLPELVALDDGKMPEMSEFESWLGPVEITSVPVPHDCSDGFLGAYWRRPAAYLDPKIRAAVSCFWSIDDPDKKLEALENDLKSGAWEQKYSDLLDLEEFDLGYRLVRAQC